MSDLIGVTLAVATALDTADVAYSVGGSLASSFSGEPRASIDADIVVGMTAATIRPFIDALGDDFYADAQSLERAVATRSTANLIHRPSGIKIDLFVAASTLDELQLQRRRRVQVATDPDRFLHIHSAEDILLQKLHWFDLGGRTSERQWRDVRAIVAVQGPHLDRTYLAGTAARVGLADLLDRLLHEAGR